MGTRRFKSVLALVLALTLCFSTNLTTASAAKKVTVKSIKVVSPAGSKKVVYVAKGKSVKLTTTVKATPNKKANKKVVYKSADKSVATVTQKGVVKGEKLGTTKITVTSVKNAKKKKTINVKVVKPISQVKLNAVNKTLSVGQTTNLKAKVTAPKTSFKTLKWTSSNKKVATVTKKGVVKAVGEGTAKITATALDGTKKKSTCTVTVANGIKSIDIEDVNYDYEADRIKVTLYTKKVLTEKDFNVKIKCLPNGIYNESLTITKVVSSDNINYYLYHNQDADYIYSGINVQVTVNALKGVKTVEKQFLADNSDKEQFVYGTVGEEINKYVYHDSTVGYVNSKIESGTLPKGLTFDSSTGYIKGVVQAVANNQKVTILQTDELGRKSRINFTFIIGDSKTIVADNPTIGNTKKEPVYAQKSVSKKITVKGGSGEYKFQLLNDYDKMFHLSTKQGTTVNVNASSVDTKAGTYVVKVKITDAANAAISTVATLTVKVTEAYDVDVVFNSSEPRNWSNYGSVYLLNVETGEMFSYASASYSTVGTKYTYNLVVPKGKYAVYYRKCGDICVGYNVSINGKTTLEYNAPDTSNINVTVKDKNGNIIKQTTTIMIYDATMPEYYQYSAQVGFGEYTIKNVASGKYFIKVTSGSETVKTGVIELKNKDIDVTVQLKVTPNN